MGLTKSHSLPDAKDRKPKARKLDGKYFIEDKSYRVVEDLVEKIYCSILNGETRYQIQKKLMEGLFEGQPKPYSIQQARAYYAAALDRIKGDSDIKQEEARNVILGRYEAIFNDAILIGDRQAALRALENMGKIYRINDDVKTNVNINTDKAGNVKIQFGFKDDDEENEE